MPRPYCVVAPVYAEQPEENCCNPVHIFTLFPSYLLRAGRRTRTPNAVASYPSITGTFLGVHRANQSSVSANFTIPAYSVIASERLDLNQRYSSFQKRRARPNCPTLGQVYSSSTCGGRGSRTLKCKRYERPGLPLAYPDIRTLYQPNCRPVLRLWQLAHRTSHLAISAAILSSAAPSATSLATPCSFSAGSL